MRSQEEAPFQPYPYGLEAREWFVGSAVKPLLEALLRMCLDAYQWESSAPGFTTQ